MSRALQLSIVSLVRRIILVVGLILLAVCGLDFLSRFPDSDIFLDPFVYWVPLEALEPAALLVFAVLCLFLPLFYVLSAAIESALMRGIVGKGTSGEDICLTPEAVERTVVREVRNAVPEVTSVRLCEASQGRNGARVLIDLAVSDSVPVPAIQEKTRRSIEETLTRLIGFADGKQIRVRVTKIAGPSKPAKTKDRRKPQRPGAKREKE